MNIINHSKHREPTKSNAKAPAQYQHTQGWWITAVRFLVGILLVLFLTSLFANYAVNGNPFSYGRTISLNAAAQAGGILQGTLGVAATAAGAYVAIYLAVLANNTIRRQGEIIEAQKYREDLAFVNERLESGMRPVLGLARALSALFSEMTLNSRAAKRKAMLDHQQALLDHNLNAQRGRTAQAQPSFEPVQAEFSYKASLSKRVLTVASQLEAVLVDSFALTIFSSVLRRRRADNVLMVIDLLPPARWAELEKAAAEGTIANVDRRALYRFWRGAAEAKSDPELCAKAETIIPEIEHAMLRFGGRDKIIDSFSELDEDSSMERHLGDLPAMLEALAQRLERDASGEQSAWSLGVRSTVAAAYATDKKGERFKHNATYIFLELGYEVDLEIGVALLYNLAQCVPRCGEDVEQTLDDLFGEIVSSPELRQRIPLMQLFQSGDPSLYIGKSLSHALIELELSGFQAAPIIPSYKNQAPAEGDRDHMRFRPINLTSDAKLGPVVMKLLEQKEFIISSDRSDPEAMLGEMLREPPSQIDFFTRLAQLREECLRPATEHFGGIIFSADGYNEETLNTCEFLGKLGYTDGAVTVDCSGRLLDSLEDDLRAAAQSGRMLILDKVESRDRKGDEKYKDIWDFIMGAKNHCDLLRREDVVTGFFVVAISYDSAADETFSGHVT